jgi:hypothetical protein
VARRRRCRWRLRTRVAAIEVEVADLEGRVLDLRRDAPLDQQPLIAVDYERTGTREIPPNGFGRLVATT